MDAHSHSQPSPASAVEFWEELYQARDQIWSGRPNAHLAEIAAGLTAGSALDVGCGEGGDAIWLARQGWRVTAVDLSPTALRRLGERAALEGLADRIDLQRHDLTETFPDGRFDLVSAQFLQSPLEFPRGEILRRAAEAVAPGGLLVIVEHAAAPPWSNHHDHEFPTVDETFGELKADPAEWQVERCETAERTATGPDGQQGTLADNIISLRRRLV